MDKEAQKEAQLQPSPSPPAYSEIDENLGNIVGESSKSTVNEDQCELEDKKEVDEKDLLEPKKAANKKKPNEPWLVNTAPRNVYNTPIEPWTTNPNLHRSHSHHQNDTYCVVCCFDNNDTKYDSETYGYHQPECNCCLDGDGVVPVMILVLTTVVAPYSVMKIATTLVAMKGVVTLVTMGVVTLVTMGVVTMHVAMKGVVGFWANCYIASQQY
ncbi:hypothetical protein HK103_004440 [Boothiomyces macroporosus]|uniref:Uncharacterized protein n=1 Tax=Boothiomyces macroporosus TaxID=261099 RepID=A0AAD5Y3D9_9FUNG|nr:hypothetical protein HK103_004440 [Boothiomyces macroporosus]